MGLRQRTEGTEAQTEKERKPGRVRGSDLGGQAPPRETEAQGDGTLAAYGSETQRRWPWAAGSGCCGEAGKKKEVAVTPGRRGNRDTQAGPYLSRRQRRRRRRDSG